MKIESFVIENFRSIKKLKMSNLNSINVFFGKNNVGKSNILRGLYLAFYSLQTTAIFLPDRMFHNRNIYKPIHITLDLALEKDFGDTEKVGKAMGEKLLDIASVIERRGRFLARAGNDVDEFLQESQSFKPVEKPRLEVQLDYNEDTSDVGVLMKDLESDYYFDYGKYRNLYRKLETVIKTEAGAEMDRALRPIIDRLTLFGVDADWTYEYERAVRFPIRPADIERRIQQLRRYISGIKEPERREEALLLLDQYREVVFKVGDELSTPFSKAFEIVRKYFTKISDCFILIPNKEYFEKGPLDEKDGDHIEIFDMDGFMEKLSALIESPSRKERELIEEFLSIFNRTYSHLGKLESVTKFRDQVLAIFGTGFISLPVEDQGLGIQDLFLYLAHMVLFDSAIVAIEEPEGGLSTENQNLLHGIIESVYGGSNKQIFLSSHSEGFETPNSYLIEMGTDGTKEISRIEKEKEYEKKIEEVLIERKLREEKEHCAALLKEITEKQMVLDILNYINKLGEKEEIDAGRISSDLGYQKARVQQVLKEITKTK